MTKLNQIERGHTVRVVSIEDGAIGRRLVEMGLFPGRQISMVRRAPLQDPIEFTVGESCLSLRECEAQLVAVEEI
ncbi:MAG TPA: ferrous iron transport protein A [candidate division Zixibacteria bacterium]|nr:ferrous iron transport protein A [candidate division Zixibacteria bacterium]